MTTKISVIWKFHINACKNSNMIENALIIHFLFRSNCDLLNLVIK